MFMFVRFIISSAMIDECLFFIFDYLDFEDVCYVLSKWDGSSEIGKRFVIRKARMEGVYISDSMFISFGGWKGIYKALFLNTTGRENVFFQHLRRL